jgi:hypothetical protein
MSYLLSHLETFFVNIFLKAFLPFFNHQFSYLEGYPVALLLTQEAIADTDMNTMSSIVWPVPKYLDKTSRLFRGSIGIFSPGCVDSSSSKEEPILHSTNLSFKK